MNHTIRAQDLDRLLDRLPAHTQVLSLDCFDTLLWRKVAHPTDVFYSLQRSALFQARGITADMRINSESAARKKRKVLAGTYEVSLSDIYRELLPQADETLIGQAVDAEVSCEIAHGFIYEPVARLIRRAHQRGLRTIVVSDTYLSSAQLRHMLSELMGEDCGLIQQIHCSSEAGKAKTTGIWPEILRRENRLPHQLFHLGDNRQADQEAPARLGIGAAWLENHPGDLVTLMGQRTIAALQVMPELRHTHALPNQFHAQLAAHDDGAADTATQIGYRSLGPVLCNFARFIQQHTQRLQVAGKSVRTAFLLRDGHMPARVCETLLGPGLARINVSRFTSIAASLYGKDDVAQLLAGSLSRQSMPALIRQLLLPDDKAKKILDKAHQAESVELEFARLVLRDDTVRLIVERSRAFRERLLTHVKQRTGVQAGDTLVLVDLGYTGTVQNRLRRAFKEELGVELFGLYLISKHTLVDGADRQGLIDGREVDSRLITALTAHIGLFEMMCSNTDPTTENFTEQGDPAYAARGPATLRKRSSSACRPPAFGSFTTPTPPPSATDRASATAPNWPDRPPPTSPG
jgi:FMN phosphatase YigB (HAD superfamily)